MSSTEQEMCGQRDDIGVYALGALEPQEAERVEQHLRACEVCREELARLRPVTQMLLRDAPAAPLPGELRTRIMRQVESEAALLTAAGAGADRAPAPRSAPRAWWAGLSPRRAGAVGGALAAACGIVLGIVLGAGGAGTPSARTIRAAVIGAPAGARAELVRAGGRAELVVAGLPQPAPGRIYQVWLARSHGRPLPTDALFSVDRSGRGSAAVPGDLQGIAQVMVTAEPLGGSPQPTSPAVIVART